MSDQITIVIPEDATMQILDTLLKSTKTVNGSSAYEVLDLIRSWRQDIVATAPAVSEDQPKPRVFPKGSPEPEGVEAVTDEAGFQWNRAGRVNAKQHHWRRADLGVMGNLVLWTRLNRRALSEVLADSEEVSR